MQLINSDQSNNWSVRCVLLNRCIPTVQFLCSHVLRGMAWPLPLLNTLVIVESLAGCSYHLSFSRSNWGLYKCRLSSVRALFSQHALPAGMFRRACRLGTPETLGWRNCSIHSEAESVFSLERQRWWGAACCNYSMCWSREARVCRASCAAVFVCACP